jgi:hypothetical protein
VAEAVVLEGDQVEMALVVVAEQELLFFLFQRLNILELQLAHHQLQHQVQILLLLGLHQEVIQHELFCTYKKWNC